MKMFYVVEELGLLFTLFSKRYPECFCSIDRGQSYASLSLFLNDSDVKTEDVEKFIDVLQVRESRIWLNNDPESHLRVLHVEWEAVED